MRVLIKGHGSGGWICLRGRGWVGVWIWVLVKFSLKPNPFSSKCTTVLFLNFYLPKSEVKRNVQKSHVLTGRDRIEENSVIYGWGWGMMVDLYLRTDRKCLHGYLSHSCRMFAVSLHLCFLAVLLHLLLQFLLLLRRPVLLLTRLPASLPVKKDNHADQVTLLNADKLLIK